MKYTLIDNKKHFYKANLHCHTNISDGKLTPEQMKKAYKEKGYSIVAFSDHELFLPHNDLTEKDFLAINATELSISDENYNQTCHINLFAKRDDIVNHPLWHREKYLFANNFTYKKFQKFDESKPDFERSFNPKCINEMIKIAKKAGFIVSLNHIEWSIDDFKNFSKYKGMTSCEVYNGGCALVGWDQDDSYLYDLYLRQGKRMYCVVGDDNHNWSDFNTIGCDSFRCYTMINSSKLDYKHIINAYLKGQFYSSTGMDISLVTYDSDTKIVHIECDPCERITIHTDNRANQFAASLDGTLTSADFKLSDPTKVFRLKVHKAGKFAWTNGYFIKDYK